MAIGSMTTNSTVDLIDKTLTISGAPADAKAVGDIILDLTKDTPEAIFYSKAEVDKLLADCKEAAKKAALLAANPVGKLWVSDDPTSPASIVGGTWEQIKDRFILAAGDTYAAGSTGGENTTWLTNENIPPLWSKLCVNGNIEYPLVIGDGDAYTGTLIPNAIVSKTMAGQQNLIARYENNEQKTINNMPPYTAVYAWKRIA